MFYACSLINKQINLVFRKHTATTINFNTPKATTLSFRNIVKGIWELGFRVWIGEFPITALFSKQGNKRGNILKPSKGKTSKQEASVGTTTKAAKATEKASSVSKILGKQSKIPIVPCQHYNHRKSKSKTSTQKAAVETTTKAAKITEKPVQIAKLQPSKQARFILFPTSTKNNNPVTTTTTESGTKIHEVVKGK